MEDAVTYTIHLHTPGTGRRRRRAAAWRGTPGVASSREEIQTGSWLWGPGRFCQAPQCKPRRGGRGAPHTFASANGPPGPPRPRPGGHGGPIQRGPAKKKSRSKPLQPLKPSQHHRHRKKPHRKEDPTVPISTHGTVEATSAVCVHSSSTILWFYAAFLTLWKVARLLAHTQLLCTLPLLKKSGTWLKW